MLKYFNTIINDYCDLIKRLQRGTKKRANSFEKALFVCLLSTNLLPEY